MVYPLFLTKLLIRSGVARFLPAVKRRSGGGGDFLRYYNDRVLAAPHALVEAAAEVLAPHGPDAIDLGSGEPRFDRVPSGSTKLPADRRGWPPVWGLPELREAVAAKLRAEHHLDANPADEILITAGAAGALSLAFDTFLNPGGRVVVFDPCSPLYTLALRYRRARVVRVPTWTEEGRTRFRYEPLVKAFRGARLVVLNSPANPAGGVLAAEDLEQIAWWADRRDVLILSDEVFAAYRYEGEAVGIQDFERARRRTLTAGGVGKEYALAAARVGWLAGHRHLIRPCALTAALQAPFVPALCQQVALAALRLDPESFRPIREEFASKRRYAFERLRSLGLDALWPAGGLSLWVPVKPLGMSGQEFARNLLAAKKVLVWPGSLFGVGGAGHVRVSFAGEDGRLREGLARLADFVRDVRAGKQEAGRAAA